MHAMTRRRTLLACLLCLILIAGAVLAFIRTRPGDPLLPSSIASQVSFIAYLPSREWETPQGQMTYQKDVLTIHSSKSGTALTISEQATPEVFNDVPDYYPALISKLNKYASLDTANGTAYLTKPTELNGQQAVLNNAGTLIFVHPSKNLSNGDWRRLFNGLQVIKP
jgi:hypothetical protein